MIKVEKDNKQKKKELNTINIRFDNFTRDFAITVHCFKECKHEKNKQTTH